MRVGVTIKGDTELLNKIDDLREAYPDIVDTEIKRTLYDIQRLAKRNAPVPGLNPYATGQLRNDIQVHEANNGGSVFNTVDHAPFVEDGTVHMSAQPYMKPAFRAGTKDLPKNIEKGIKDNT